MHFILFLDDVAVNHNSSLGRLYRAAVLGDGSITHKLVETAVGIFMQSPDTYAKRIVPLLFARELEGRTGLMFGHKAQPILPTQGLDSAYIDRYLSASEALLRRALS
jgi:hypothetical protein